MSALLCIGYGTAIFLGAGATGFIYHFIVSFCESAKRPLSEGKKRVLRLFEGGAEIVVVIAITAYIMKSNSDNPYAMATGSYLVTVLLSLVDKKFSKKSNVEYWGRLVPTLALCFGVATYIAKRASDA
jgi:hypothetical protein